MECLFDVDKPHFAAWLWIHNEDMAFVSMWPKHPEKPKAVPLYYAAVLGLRELAEHLITKHPEHVNARGFGRCLTAIHAAADAGHVNIISLLVEHGADVNSRISGEIPLHRAAWRGRLAAGQYLLDHGADVNARDDQRFTPLIPAFHRGHLEFARMLLRRGAVISNRIYSSDAVFYCTFQQE